MIIVKFIIHIGAILGLILTLGNILGWFVDKDRVEFLKIINEKHKCSPDHPGARKFLKSFFYPLPATKEEKSKPIGEIAFTGLFRKGGSINEILSGSIIVRNKDGEKTRGLCTYSELQSWSKEAPFWKWTGWSILAISIILGIAIFILETKLKSSG